MSIAIRNINLIIAAAGIALCSLNMIQAKTNRFIEKGMKNFFIGFFAVIDAYVVCIITREFTHTFTGAEWVTVSRIAFFGQALLSSVLTILVTAFILYQSGERDWFRNKIFIISLALWLIYVGVLIYAQFTKNIYYVDEENNYHRGPYFSIIMIVPIIIMIVNLFATWKKKEQLSERQIRAFLVYAILPTICMVLQSRLFGIHFIVLGTVAAALYMFMDILTEQREGLALKEVENAKLKNDILLAQIRPHFLFNALTTIKHLIKTDPEKAEKAMVQYTSYLRHNMDSITSNETVSFKEELEHVKGYLEIQKLRFGDELEIECDVSYTDFKLPTLTLLPLVENAITYGTRRNPDRTGRVRISSEKYDDRIEVTVEDDGPGFVPEALPDDRKRSHVGLENVKARIEHVAKGKLIIDSELGKGTKVTIVLPVY